jgi:hypothetical protein
MNKYFEILNISLDIEYEDIVDNGIVVGYSIPSHKIIKIEYLDKGNALVAEVLQAVIDKINWVDK